VAIAKLDKLDKNGLTIDAIRLSIPRTRQVTRKVLKQSTVLCPVDTGRLRASGKMKFRIARNRPIGVVVYAVKYAAAVHDGSGPHIIRPKKKKALRFVVAGRVVYATKVHHPGSPPRPFLRHAAELVAVAEGLRFVPSKSDVTPDGG
jgi:hypothetical protein